MHGSSQPAEAASRAHEPFTREERLQQLSQIDQDIASLLTLTGGALKALSGPEPPPLSDTAAATDGAPDPEAQTTAFKTAMNSFLATLHSVDVRLKRQIMGLEEAGIVSLKETKGAASLEPNGLGQIGSLDVGWLNSRSNKVERDMEAELWARARAHLGRVVEGSGGEAKDVYMEG